MKRIAIPSVTILLALAGMSTVPRQAAAQFGPSPDQPDMTLDAATRAAVLDTLIDRIDKRYVFPDVAKEVIKALRRRAAHKEYDGITSAMAFADSLTAHVRAVSHDRHMRTGYSHDPLPLETGTGEPSPAEIEQQRRNWRLRNYGFEKVQRLAGNVGYLELRGFVTPRLGGGETAVAAMNFLANSDALIIDLRRNGGGDPEMLDLLVSYLYEEGERIHLNDFYERDGNRTEQFYTLSHTSGPHLAGKDVYVLTSSRTGSCAEEMAYDLQSLKRATLVGETTVGAANPGGFRRLNEHFTTFIPTGRAVNPVTGKNWEGVGVKPDVEAPVDQALKVAHVAALKKLIEKTTDEEDKKRLGRALEEAEKQPAEPIGDAPGMRHPAPGH